jgi:hypothetical protein
MSVGKADFTVAQKGASDTLSSTIDRQQLARIRQTPGVANAIGVLVETERLNADNPVFIEIGINPSDLAGFGVNLVRGRPYSSAAGHEVMLGWRAAANLGLQVARLGGAFAALARSGLLRPATSLNRAYRIRAVGARRARTAQWPAHDGPRLGCHPQ